jgi:hypothetical protein
MHALKTLKKFFAGAREIFLQNVTFAGQKTLLARLCEPNV